MYYSTISENKTFKLCNSKLVAYTVSQAVSSLFYWDFPPHQKPLLRCFQGSTVLVEFPL